MEIAGKILLINNTRIISDRLKKRTFVASCYNDSDWPQKIEFECVNSHCKMLDKLTINEEYIINFSLKGKYPPPSQIAIFNKPFNRLEAWSIKPLQTCDKTTNTINPYNSE